MSVWKWSRQSQVPSWTEETEAVWSWKTDKGEARGIRRGKEDYTRELDHLCESEWAEEGNSHSWEWEECVGLSKQDEESWSARFEWDDQYSN